MLGRKNYIQEEFDHAQTAIDRQLETYTKLVTGDAEARAALDECEPLFMNNMTLVLDRYFVHRIRRGEVRVEVLDRDRPDGRVQAHVHPAKENAAWLTGSADQP